MRIAALVLLGYICLLRLPIDLLPRVDIPTVAVNVSWPNTAPEEMETQIARPIEQAVSTVRGMYIVTSTSTLGAVSVRVQFNYGVNVDQAAIDVMQAVQRAQGRFPSDPTISQPSIFKFDPTSLPILVYGVSSDTMDLIHLRARLSNEISPMIEAAGGVASVNISGGQDRAIIVDVDPAKLQAHNVNLTDISKRLQQENVSLPAGVAKEGKSQFSLRSIGYFKSLDEIRRLPVSSKNGHLVSLQEVAEVRDASLDVLSYTRMNGKPALNVSVTKQSDANTVETAQNIQTAIAEIVKRNPDLVFSNAYDQAKFIENSIDDLKNTAVIGGVLAIIIITFFLRNLRSTFVVALSIPISIVSTFALLYFCGFTLNTISLSGLALASGLIVDDAIVVLENIYRHVERDGKDPRTAAIEGTQEIISAVLASTFTVMIVFLPLLLIKGQTGQTFTQFALVVIFSISVSLLDATTVVPMLASRMINLKDVMAEAHPERRAELGIKNTAMLRMFDKVGAFLDRMDHSYRRGLEWAIHHRIKMVGIALIAILAAVGMWPLVGKEQLPQTDSGNLTIRLKLAIGTRVEVTDVAMKRLEKIVIDDPDVETIIAGAGANVGLRGAGTGNSNEGSATLKLKANRKSTTGEVSKRLQKSLAVIPGARVLIQPLDMVANTLGGNQIGFSVDVYGQDLTQLTAVARQVQQAMSEVPGMQNVDLGVQDAAPEVQWSIDREKAQTLGVSFQDVANTIAASTNGQLSSYYQENGFQYPIYVQVAQSKRLTVDDLKRLPITAAGSLAQSIPLGQVATAKYGIGPNQITRQNRQRMINVGGNIIDRPESQVQTEIKNALAKLDFPAGTYWTVGVQQMQRDKDFSGLGLAVFLAIALIYMLLATQFESFVYPLIVLVSVPLCAIGLVLALFLTNRAFGMTAFIGLLMLIGIVVKNGILLVDYTNQLRERGMSRDEAILTAGPTRLRPILMTTLAAILGMLPLAIGIGSGSEMYVPLATAVIGGLATSTMLTLFVVPTVYTIFDDLIARRNRHKEGAANV